MLDIEKIKKDFPIFKRKVNGHELVYLDSGATSQKPNEVIEAISDYYKNNNANIHRGVYQLSVESTQMVDEARAAVAAFIGGMFEEIIFTRNTSESINLVMYAWGKENIKSGDSVIVTKLEHHSNLIPWQELCREKGAELRVVDIDNEGRLKLTGETTESFEENGLRVKIGSLEKMLDNSVKMVAVTGVSNVLGTITPLEEIVRMVKKSSSKALILVDAAQMVPHMQVDVKKIGADFLAFSGHKMLGPTGIGILWARKELLDGMDPFLFGGDMIGEVKITGATWADLPSKFEAGTPDIAGIVGLGAAVSYLKKTNMNRVREHERELIAYALDKFSVLEDKKIITIYGPMDPEKRGGVLTFNVNGYHAHDVASILDSFGIAVRSGQHCAAPLVTGFGVMAMVRATFYIYNEKKDIDYLVDKIMEVPKVFA